MSQASQPSQAPSVEEVKVLARFLRSAYGHCTEDAAAIASAFASLEVAKNAWRGGGGEEAAGNGPTDIGGALSAALAAHGVMARPIPPRDEDEDESEDEDDEDDDDDEEYAALEREQLQFRQERKVSAAAAAATVRRPTPTTSRQQVSIPKTVVGTATTKDALTQHDEALARAEQALEREKHDNIVKMKARYMHGDEDDEDDEDDEADEAQPVPTSRPRTSNRDPQPHRRSFPHPREQSSMPTEEMALTEGSSSDPDALVALRMKLQQEEDNPSLASASDKYPDLATNVVGEDVLLLARMLRSSGHDIPNAAAIAMAFAGLADSEGESSDEEEEDGRGQC